MLVVRLVVAACVLLVLAACGTSHAADTALPAAMPTGVAGQAERSAKDLTRSIGDGVTLSVSAPTSFTPTDEAYPKAVRAVAIELVIHNEGDTVYRPTQLSFTATADGQQADQVIDSTQGYNGVAGGADEVQPTSTARFAIAFAVPQEQCTVRVIARSESGSTGTIPIFDGVI